MASVTDEILQLINGCSRHGHEPEVIHLRRSTIDRLCNESLGSVSEPGAFSKKAVDEEVERRRVMLTEGGTVFGITFVPEPSAQEMWVHGDGLSR